MRVNCIVNTNGAGGITAIIFDLTAESEHEELVLRLADRGKIAEKMSCKTQDGKLLSTTMVIVPTKTAYRGIAWADSEPAKDEYLKWETDE